MALTHSAALDAHISASLFRITNATGHTLGSGFAIAGGVLTCAHVIAGHRPDEVRAFWGPQPLAVLDYMVSWELDVAFLLIEEQPEGLGVALGRPEQLVIAGHPRLPGLSGALTTRAIVDGISAISYSAQGKEFALTQVWTLPNGLILPGSSGGPAVDPESGAAVGIVVADFVLPPGKTGLAGFVQPVEHLLGDPQIGAPLASALEACPRFGPIPNRAGAQIWCRWAVETELVRMNQERRFAPETVVPREAITARVARFLNDDAQLLAVVDRSGLGKSTALAQIALMGGERPTLFLRAMEIDDLSVSLDVMVSRKLEAVKPAHIGKTTDLAGLAASGDIPPLIIVDGLNEARISEQDMRDRWLPEAVRQAKGCKIIFSCRPEHWGAISERLRPRSFRSSQSVGDEPLDTQPVGEFSEAERRAYLQLVGAAPGFTRSLHDPMLLGLAADLQDELSDRRLSRWYLMKSWVTRDCRRAADSVPVSARLVENLLERLARTCLERDVQVIDRNDPLASDPAFDGLLREHLLVEQGTSFGFRHDLLFEHLAARTLDVRRLEVVDGRWSQDGFRIGWSVVLALCDRAADRGDIGELDLLWSHLLDLAPASSFHLVRCIATLPMTKAREPAATDAFEVLAAEGAYGFMLAGSELADAQWSREFAQDVLRLIVRASSGYDFRENDLSEPMRFARDSVQFEVQGFHPQVAALLERDRSAFLATLGEWHLEQEKLGLICNDTTRESTISSWTSCCFVFCSDLFSDAELLSAPAAQYSGAVFRGLALHDPRRLLKLSTLMAEAQPIDAPRFRRLLSALHGMADTVADQYSDRFRDAACRLGMARFDELQDTLIQNYVIGWAAQQDEFREEAWQHLVRLAERAEAEGSALQAFLPHMPTAAVALAKRIPKGFATLYGSILLDLARPSPLWPELVPFSVTECRMKILAEAIAADGSITTRSCDVIDLLIHEFDPEVAEKVGLVEIALAAINSGAPAKPLVYFSGDQNARWEGAKLALADRLARAFATKNPDPDVIEHLLALRLTRAARSPSLGHDLVVLRELASTVAQRFGSEALIGALGGGSLLVAFARDGRLDAILNAYDVEPEDPRLAAAIDQVRRAKE